MRTDYPNFKIRAFDQETIFKLYLANHFIFTLSSQQNHYKLPQAACELAQTRFNKQITHPVSPD